jgi:hypothetical protein
MADDEERQEGAAQDPEEATHPRVTALAELFREVRPWHATKKRKWQTDEFDQSWRLHYDRNHINAETRVEVEAVQPIIVRREVATMKENIFMINKTTCDDLKLISVITKSAQQLMEARGWVTIDCDHHTNSNNLPSRAPSSDATPMSLLDTPAPSGPTFPTKDQCGGKLPDTYSGNGMNTATAIVMAFEEKVIFKEVVYSPLRLWDADIINKKLMITEKSKLPALCKVYMAIRFLHRLENPKTMDNASYKTLTEEYKSKQTEFIEKFGSEWANLTLPQKACMVYDRHASIGLN